MAPRILLRPHNGRRPSEGRGRSRGAQALLWLLLVPLIVLVSLPFSALMVEEGRATTSRGSGGGRHPLPPPRAALTSFLREGSHMVIKPLPTMAPAPVVVAPPAVKKAAAASVPTTPVVTATAPDAAADTAPQPPVVEVVYCINLPEDTSFFRIDYGEIEALFRQTVRHLLPNAAASTTNTTSNTTTTANTTAAAPLVRFHLLSNDDEAIGRIRAVHPGLRVHDYRLAPPSARSESFLQRYVHQSVNPMEMERLCMWRWILTADYFSQLLNATDKTDEPPPGLILGIDTDVALFQHPGRLLSEWKLAHWADKGFECHQIALGAAMLWSPLGLESFADFIGRAYTTPGEAARRVKEWGATFPYCRPQRSVLLPCDANATKPEMWHLSDMDLLRAWLLQNSTVRTRKEEERCLVVRQAKKVPGLRLFLAETETAVAPPPMKTLMGVRPPAASQTTTPTDEANDATTAEAEAEEVCLLHFQGPGSKKLIVPFEAFMEGGNGTATTAHGDEFVLP